MTLQMLLHQFVALNAGCARNWRRTRRAVSRIWLRLADDHVIFLAGSLAFFSVTALIPISAISLSLFASYINEEQEEIFYDYILDYIFPFSPENRISIVGETIDADAPVDGIGSGAAPDAAKSAPVFDLQEVERTVKENIRTFTDQARNVGWVGLIFLIITGIWLFDSIEDAFNAIWRSEKRRPFVRRFLIFWTVLTLTPLLMVGPILIDRYLKSKDFLPDNITWLNSGLAWFSFLLPYFLTWLAIWLLYVLVPNGTVSWKPAAISAFMVAFLWQLAKHLFAEYVAHAKLYQSVYGSLSLVAFVIAWIYYTWWLILAGLEMTSYLHNPDWDQATPLSDMAPEINLLYSWGGLHQIGRSFQLGEGGISCDVIALNLGLNKMRTLRLLENLEEKRLLARDSRGLWYPAVPLSRITWQDLAKALEYDLDNSTVRLSEWLESALQARGLTNFEQNLANLPSLALVLEKQLHPAHAAGMGADFKPEMPISALPEPSSATGPENGNA